MAIEIKYSVYPFALDGTDQLPITSDNVTEVNAEVVNRQRSAIIAVEGELGIDPSGVYTTVRARLDALESLIGSLGGNEEGITTVLDEGVIIDSSASSIDFVGDIITATSDGSGNITVTVDGYAGASSQVQETIAVTAPGQTAFTISQDPADASAVEMFINGIKQQHGSDYVVSGTSVTYLSSGTYSLNVTDVVEFWYLVTGIILPGGGSDIIVQDEGVTFESAATLFNFRGDVVVASSGGTGVVNVDINTATWGETLAIANTSDGIDLNLNLGSVIFSSDGYVKVDDDLYITGKLTVDGLIDPTGLVLNEQASSPNTNASDEGSVWVRDDRDLIYTDQTNTDYVIGGSGAYTKYTVGPAFSGAEFTTVQAAIDQAVSDGVGGSFGGARFEIYPGFYSESVVIPETLPNFHLVGTGADNGSYISNITINLPNTSSHWWSIFNIGFTNMTINQAVSGSGGLNGRIESCKYYGDVTVTAPDLNIRFYSCRGAGAGSLGTTTVSCSRAEFFQCLFYSSATTTVLDLNASVYSRIVGCWFVGIILTQGNTYEMNGCTQYFNTTYAVQDSCTNLSHVENNAFHFTGSVQQYAYLKSGTSLLEEQGNSFSGDINPPFFNVTGGTIINGNISVGKIYNENNIDLETNAGTVSIIGDGYVSGDFDITGKLTVGGLIDPTGLVLNEQASSPNTNASDEGSVWVRDDGYLIYTDQTNTDYAIGGPGIGGGTVEDLATTLSAGNITDGTDIELSDNDIITAESITGTLRLRTKDNGAGVSGEIALHSGSATDSGDINIFTGSSTGTAGNINIDTGDSTSSGNSGNMTVSTGNAVSGDSGGMTVRTGGGGGAGGGGTLQLTAGNGGNTGAGGDVLINAGSAGTSGSQNGGDITISPGNATSGNGGNLVLSGSSSSSGTDGNIQISTFDARITIATSSSVGGTIELGDAGTLTSGIRLASNERIYLDGATGDVVLTTLDLSAGSTATDGLIIKSGNQTSTGSSGDVTVQSGTATSGTSKTGDVDILTPPAGAGTLGSGNISLTTGDGNAGGSGNVTVTTGPGQGSEPGDVIFTTGAGGGGDGIGGEFTVTTGAGSSTGDGGNLELTTGNGGSTSGSGGTMNITIGSASTSGSAGQFNITGGDGIGLGGTNFNWTAGNSDTGNAGTVNLNAGNATSSGNGGSVNIGAGSSSGGTPGFLTISSGSGTGGNSSGSNLVIDAGNGNGAGNGADVNIDAGNGGNTTGDGGDINLTAGSTTGGTIGQINMNSNVYMISTGMRTPDASGAANANSLIFEPGDATGTGSGGGIQINMGSGASGSDFNLNGGSANGNSPSGTGSTFNLLPGDGYGTGVGGSFNLTAGAGGSSADGGDVSITAGDGGSVSGNSGDITLTTQLPTDGNSGNIQLIINNAAGSTSNAGVMNITGGDAPGSGSGTNFNWYAGDSVTGFGGTVNIGAGAASSTGTGGSVNIDAGDSAGGTPGFLTMSSGSATAGNASGSNFIITAGSGFGSGNGAVANIIAGNGGATGNGGDVFIRSGGGGSTSGNAGDVDIIGNNATSGTGGNVNLTPGTGSTDGTVFINGDGYVTGDFEVDGKLTVNGIIDPTGLVLNVQNSNPTTPALNSGTIWIKNAESIGDGYTTVTSSSLVFTGEESNVYESISRETYHRGDTPIFASKKIYFHVDGPDGQDQVFTMPDTINGVSASTLSGLDPAGCLIVTFDLVYTWSTGSSQAQVNSGTALFEESGGSWVFIEMITSEPTTVLSASAPGGVPTFTLNASGYSGTEVVRYMMDVEIKIMGIA